MFTLAFLKDAAERAVSTAAQAAIAVLVTLGGLAEIDWVQLGSIAGLAAAVSLLKSIVASRLGDESASLVTPAKHAA